MKLIVPVILAFGLGVFPSPAADMTGYAGRGYAPGASSSCETFHPLYITGDPNNSQKTIIRNNSDEIIEVEYAQIGATGNPITRRYIHLTGNEQRSILNVGLSECVTDTSSRWFRGPSASGKFDFYKSGSVWKIKNKTNHYIAVRIDLVIRSGASPVSPGTKAWSFQTIAPAKTTNVWFDNDPADDISIAYSFEDVYPY